MTEPNVEPQKPIENWDPIEGPALTPELIRGEQAWIKQQQEKQKEEAREELDRQQVIEAFVAENGVQPTTREVEMALQGIRLERTKQAAAINDATGRRQIHNMF